VPTTHPIELTASALKVSAQALNIAQIRIQVRGSSHAIPGDRRQD